MKRLKDNQYFHLGAMLLGILTICILLLAVVLNLGSVGKILKTVGNVFSPLILGFVLAYLMNPLMNFMDRRLNPLLTKKMKKQEKAKTMSRVISLVFAVLVFTIMVYEFFALLLPQLYESIRGIVSNFSTYYNNIERWVTAFLEDNPEMAYYVNDFLDKGFSFLEDWFNTGLMDSIETILTGLTSSVMTVVGVVLDLIIGLCAAIYMLWSRDLFTAQSKKIVVALFKEQTADHLMDLGRNVHKIFSGFIIGKIVDSLIIGVLCYLGMLVLHLPYPALIATVVGVTNIIPFFGPFIGAIPSVFLILLVQPMQAVYFSLFVLALQQLDGNVIGPKILGDTVGISGFWVLVSITVAGGLFGFAGMVLGVPVFAVLYMLISDSISSRLTRKGMSTNTDQFLGIQTAAEVRSDPEEPKTE